MVQKRINIRAGEGGTRTVRRYVKTKKSTIPLHALVAIEMTTFHFAEGPWGKIPALETDGL